MNGLNDISDDDFVPFLHNLGVETYKKSFEWMLNDRDFAGVLRWLYNNLDHSNALNAREECRYIELEKKEQLLSTEELEESIVNIQEQFQGICLPGEKDAVEDAMLDINMLKERLSLLEKQEVVVADLVRRNELNKEELIKEITRLNSAHQQSADDVTTIADECLTLAQEVEDATDGVIDVVADTLAVYTSCHSDKENAKKFFTFGPLETYRQSQALFRSHFDLYIAKKFAKRQNDVTDEELRTAMIEAKSLEDRLTDAVSAYIESKAELCGEQAFLTFMDNYKDVHPSQITSCLLEAQSALELLEQEESILEQQLQNAIKQLVDYRTTLALQTTANCALTVRQEVHTELSHLLDVTHRALSLDRVVYGALRHELRVLDQFLQFASQLRHYVIAEADAVSSRIDSMNEICFEQKSCELHVESSDVLLQTLARILGTNSSNAVILVKVFNELLNNVKELKSEVFEGYQRREKSILDIKSSTASLRLYIWDGSTKQPNAWDRTVAALAHTLKQNMEAVDKRVVDASNMFATVKNGDKQCLRKLWQWFLTDPSKLMTALKHDRYCSEEQVPWRNWRLCSTLSSR